MTTTTVNAQITKTRMGIQHHGIFTASVCLEWNHGSCWFGDWTLDQYVEEEKTRIGTSFGMQYIKDLIRASGAATWEEVTGRFVRVEVDDNDRVLRMRHLTQDDKSFDPAALAAKMKDFRL